MKYLVKKDLIRRKQFSFLELKNVCLKFFIIFILNSQKIQIDKNLLFRFIVFKKSKKNYSFGKSKLVRRCVLTGRSRGSVRFLGGVSRTPLKELLSFGIIMGYKKAVW